MSEAPIYQIDIRKGVSDTYIRKGFPITIFLIVSNNSSLKINGIIRDRVPSGLKIVKVNSSELKVNGREIIGKIGIDPGVLKEYSYVVVGEEESELWLPRAELFFGKYVRRSEKQFLSIGEGFGENLVIHEKVEVKIDRSGEGKILRGSDVKHTLSDVIGNDVAKKILWENIVEQFLSRGKPINVLLKGITGTGKSFLAESVAGELFKRGLNVNVYKINYNTVSQGINISMFKEPAIIIAEDIDLYAQKSLFTSHEKSVFKEFLEKISDKNIVVIGTTSNPSIISDDIRRRFVEVDVRLPTSKESVEILEKYLKSFSPGRDVLEKMVRGRLKMFTQAELVRIAELAIKRALKNGREKICENDILEVLENVKPLVERLKERRWYIPLDSFRDELSLDELWIEEDVRRIIKLYIDFLKHPEKMKEVGYRLKPILFYGETGTGKTSIVKAICKELNIGMLVVEQSIFDKYVGVSENNLYTIFEIAKTFTPSVILIDEMDSIFRNRDQDIHEVSRNLQSILLRKLDGVEKMKGVLVIATTNRIEDIDPALLRRFRRIEIRRPTKIEAFLKIFLTHFNRGNPCKELSEDDMKYIKDYIVPAISGMTPAKIRDIVDRAMEIAMSDGRTCIEIKDVEKALDEMGERNVKQ